MCTMQLTGNIQIPFDFVMPFLFNCIIDMLMKLRIKPKASCARKSKLVDFIKPILKKIQYINIFNILVCV